MPIRISITGVLGGGKSAVCDELVKYNLKYFSTGLIQRKLAVGMNMTTLALNEYSETHPEIDEQIDNELRKLSERGEDMVIDSRMAWHFVKDTFKVFLWADETVAACRVMSHERGPSEKYESRDRAKCDLKARKCSENTRFKDKYGVDCGNLLNYDLIIDTTDILPEHIAGIIMDKCLHRNPADGKPVLLISPKCLYPTDFGIDAGTDGPVSVIYSGGYFFIYKGHAAVGSVCKAEKPSAVVCALAGQNADILNPGVTADGYARGEFSVHKARDWEKANGFRYFTVPDFKL